MLKKIAGLAAAAITAGAALSACGTSPDPTYAPAAYWQTVDNVHECYYVDDTQEAYNLMAAGLCPAGSMPTLAPLTWQEEYWSYYSSPAYYSTYMPVAYRSHYTSVTVVHFSSTYKTQISAASSKAVYKSSTGGTVTGSKVNATSFGGGSRTTKSYGGGSRGNSPGSNSYSGSRSAGRK